MTMLQAHRGVSSEYPENTLAAFRAAVEEGYGLIECDPKFTKDEQFVILHDRTLNRTCRTPNGEKLPAEVKIADLTLEEARSYDAGLWMGEKFRGEKIPTLAETLDFAEQNPIPLKLDNVWETFPEALQDKFLDEIAARGDKIHVGITCGHRATLRKAAARLPHADLHYDGGNLSPERLEEVKEIARGHHLYVWVCYDNARTKWFKGQKATPELCDFVRSYGELGIWILSEREEMEKAVREYRPDIIETTGHIKPSWLK